MLSSALVPKYAPLVEAKDFTFTLADGKKVCDLAGQTLNLSLGQGNQCVLDAAKVQMDKSQFASSRFATPVYLELNDRLSSLAPEGLSTTILKLSNGSDAVETATKLARMYTRREKIACLQNAWHGESYHTLGMSTAHTGRLVASKGEVVFAKDSEIESLANLVEQSSNIAAAIVDPIGVCNGLRKQDPGPALARLRKACTDAGTLLIFDEIQTFGGYLGTSLFASDSFGVKPDIICLGKALGFGFPLAAVICDDKLGGVLQYNDGEFTYGGHPVSCAAALAGLDVLSSLKMTLADRVAPFKELIHSMFPSEVYEVRCTGLVATVGLQDPTLTEAWCSSVVEKCMSVGIFCRTADYGTRLLLKPSVTMPLSDLKEKLKVLEEIATETLSQRSIALRSKGVLDSRIGIIEVSMACSDEPSLNQVALAKQFGCGLAIAKRDIEQQSFLTKQLIKIGVPAIPVYPFDGAANAVCHELTDPKALGQVLERSEAEKEINALVLRHYEIVVLAHDRGLVIGNRTPANALVGKNDVVRLKNFSLALAGPYQVQALFEEIFTIVHTICSLRKSDVRSGLTSRLLESLYRRHDQTSVQDGIESFRKHYLCRADMVDSKQSRDSYNVFFDDVLRFSGNVRSTRLRQWA